MSTFTVASTIRQYPTAPYERIKTAVIGKHYAVSLVFVGPDRARTLNQQTRGKDYVPNVLSLPLTDAQGEIYLCPAAIAREAAAFGRTLKTQCMFLFIHGLLHLKGHDHGVTMERLERTYCRQFNCLPKQG